MIPSKKSLAALAFLLALWPYVSSVANEAEESCRAFQADGALVGAEEGQEIVGYFKRVEGAVVIHRSGETEALPAAVGMAVKATDAVEAGSDGAFDAIFNDNSSVSGVASTCFQIAEFYFDPSRSQGRFNMRLKRGVVSITSGEISKLKNGSMNVRIRRDTNLVVSGTRFVVRAL